jgi:capsular polysaccharide biosynthesis protein
LEIRRYLWIVRRHVFLVVAIVVAAVIAGFLVTPRHSTFTATSTLYVGSRSIDIDPTSGQVSGERVAGLDRLIATFAAMASTEPIATDAAKVAGVARSAEDIASHTAAQQVPETDLIHVAVTDGDAATSQVLANAVATSLVDQVRRFEPRSKRAEADQVISLYEPATAPVENSKGTTRNLVLAGLFGILVAGALVALLEYLDISVRSADDVERQLELPVLAVVPALGREMPIQASDAQRPDA